MFKTKFRAIQKISLSGLEGGWVTSLRGAMCISSFFEGVPYIKQVLGQQVSCKQGLT